MKKMVFIFVFFSCLYPALAQFTGDSLRNRSIGLLLNIQKNIIGENSIIYYGREYTGYDHQLDGDPYYLSDTMVMAKLYYKGFSFYDLRMLYNIYFDNIIIYNPYKKLTISLPCEKIDSFRFLGHLFVWMTTDSLARNSLKSGFYDKAYSGNSQVLIRQTKSITRPLNPRELSGFVLETNYFIKKEGNYFPVDSKNQLLEVFRDKKKPLLKYLHANKLRYKKNAVNTIVKAAQYYDQKK